MNEYLSYIKKSFKMKDSEIVKDIIDRVTNKKESFNISRISKVYKVSFVEANEIYTYLEQTGYVKARLSESSYEDLCKDSEQVELKINIPNEIEEEFLKYTKVYGDTLEEYSYYVIYEYLKDNQVDDSILENECVRNLITEIKKKTIKKEDLTLAGIQRRCAVGFSLAKRIEAYLKDNGLI